MFRSEYGDYPPFLGRALILALIVSLLIAALCLGAMLPGRMIGPGLDQYEGEKKVFAIAALSEMESTALRETTDAYIAVAYRVVDVERCAPPPARAFRMEVRLYTIFGIPYGEEKTACTDPLPG